MTRDRRGPLPVPWCFAVATALLLIGIGLLPLPLYAQQPEIVDAPGSISGTVTNAAGQPLADIEVTLHNEGTTFYRAPIFTDPNGAYTFTFLRAGIYKIGYSDPNALYAPAFYPDVGRLDEATEIVVTGNDVTGIDAHLDVGGVITGTLTFAASPPRSWSFDMTLWRYQRDTGLLLERYASASARREETTFDFTFGGLATDAYYLCVAANAYLPNDAPNGSTDIRHLNECYDDRAFIDLGHLWGNQSFAPEDLNPIAVQAGQTTGVIDMVLGDPADRGSIAGQVYARDGRPLQGIDVQLSSASPSRTNLGSSVSDAEGQYRFADVAPGEYYIRACDETAEFVGRYYRDEDTDDCYYPGESGPQSAEVVILAPFETKLGVDLALNPAAVITGTVSLNGRVPPRARVVAYRLESGRTAQADIDSATGQYALVGLAPGTYEVTAYVDVDRTSLEQTYITDDGQTQFTLDVGDRKAGIDFVMEAALYDRAIRGVVLGDGNPVQGIRVDLYEDGAREILLVYTVTDANGRYRIDGLAEAGYSFRFSDPQNHYATAYSNDADTPYDPEWIVVRDERHTADYNIALPRAGSIEGRVFMPEGQARADYRVQSYFMQLVEYSPGQKVYVESRGPVAAVEPDGAYTLHGLYPGVYRVGLEDLSNALPAVYYPQASFDAAKNLHVAAGTVVVDINFYPGRGPRVYLPLMPGD